MKNTKTTLWITLALALILFLFLACKDKSPTSPSPTPQPPSATSLTAPESVSEPVSSPLPPSKPVVARIFGATGKSIRAEFQNNSGKTIKVGLACYEAPTDEIGDQTLYAADSGHLLASEATITLKVDLPPCKAQCDAFTDRRTPRKIPYYTPNELLAFWEGGHGLCEEIPPPPKGCVQPPDPTKPGFECVWNADICRWMCKCVPTEKPACPELIWDPASCSYVGGCCPKPIGEPECPEQVWDVVKCKYVGECLACPQGGTPECPEQVWDDVACKWVGECSEV